MNLAEFIETFQEAITRAVLRTYPPLYSARNRNDWGFDLRRLRRRPLGRLNICRPFADQIVGRGAPGLGRRGMTQADFRYKMGLVGAVRDQAGQAATLS